MACVSNVFGRIKNLSLRSVVVYTPERRECPRHLLLNDDWTLEEFKKEGFKMVGLYSNVPYRLLCDTLVESSEKNPEAREHVLLPIRTVPELLEKVVEKNLTPYALFIR